MNQLRAVFVVSSLVIHNKPTTEYSKPNKRQLPKKDCQSSPSQDLLMFNSSGGGTVDAFRPHSHLLQTPYPLSTLHTPPRQHRDTLFRQPGKVRSTCAQANMSKSRRQRTKFDPFPVHNCLMVPSQAKVRREHQHS